MIDEWCVSAAALRFMRSLFTNHNMNEGQHMLPCCGHSLISSDDQQTVFIYGCCNGVDFDVIHDNDQVIIRMDGSKVYTYSYDEYVKMVVDFVNEVEQFYINSPKRIVPKSEPEKSGFEAFKNEWLHLKGRLKSIVTD